MLSLDLSKFGWYDRNWKVLFWWKSLEIKAKIWKNRRLSFRSHHQKACFLSIQKSIINLPQSIPKPLIFFSKITDTDANHFPSQSSSFFNKAKECQSASSSLATSSIFAYYPPSPSQSNPPHFTSLHSPQTLCWSCIRIPAWPRWYLSWSRHWRFQCWSLLTCFWVYPLMMAA